MEPSSKEEYALEVVSLKKRFGSLEVLKGIDFAVRKGEIFVLMGGSGSGKTVLLKHFLRLLIPEDGEVRVEGVPLHTFTEDEFLSYLKRVGVVFQGSALLDSLTTFENIAFPLRQHTDLSEKEVRDRVEELLFRVGLSGFGERYPQELSGGMRKRAGIARALALSPDFLFFDEPTSGLDPLTSAVIEELVLHLHREGSFTGFVITHSIETARRLGDRIALLHKGKIHFVGDFLQFVNSQDPVVQAFVKRDPDLIRTYGVAE